MNTPSAATVSLKQIQQLLSCPPVVKEFFLPLDYARLHGNRLTVDGNKVPPSITGVRLQRPDATNRDHSAEQQVQSDLKGLVQSIVELRRHPQLAGAVLSDEVIFGKSPTGGKRAQFGITFDPNSNFKSESQAAPECQRQILVAMDKAGFEPETKEAVTDFAGLSRWVGQVRLVKKEFPISQKWLLALIPVALLLLYLFWPKSNGGPTVVDKIPQKVTKFAGIDLGPQGVIIVLDKSSSMAPCFPTVKSEAERALQELLQIRDRKTYVDLIIYDDQATSALGSLKELTPAVKVQITDFLETLRDGGGTKLESAIKLAGAEVIQLGQETTLIVITDGEDPTIPQMIADASQTRSRFGSVPFKIHMTHPDLLPGSGRPLLQSNYVASMKQFADLFSGNFGPTPVVAAGSVPSATKSP